MDLETPEQPTFISANLGEEDREELIALLKYGLFRDPAVHKLAIDPSARSGQKRGPRKMRLEIETALQKKEVDRGQFHQRKRIPE